MTKTEQLQKIVDDYVESEPCLHRFIVEFRGRGGWWGVPEDGARYFGDRGEYLGRNFNQAKQTLNFLLA